jgi:hypothetical protein
MRPMPPQPAQARTKLGFRVRVLDDYDLERRDRGADPATRWQFLGR